MPLKSTKILSIVDDLFFVVKISDTAKRAGLSPEFVKTPADLLAQCEAAAPLMVLVDLNNAATQPVELITALRALPSMKGVSIIAFVSHVEVELKNRAQDAGASMVLARSAFSASLPQIFKRHTGVF